MRLDRVYPEGPRAMGQVVALTEDWVWRPEGSLRLLQSITASSNASYDCREANAHP